MLACALDDWRANSAGWQPPQAFALQVLRGAHRGVEHPARLDVAQLAVLGSVRLDPSDGHHGIVLLALDRLVGDQGDAKVLVRRYGQVAVVAVDSGRSHGLRLWVKRTAGWQALHFNEIIQPDSQATAGDVAVPSEAGVVTPCINPCKRVPYKATSPSAQAAMTALQELDTASANRDMELWASRVLEECLIVDSAGTRPITKAERMAKPIQQEKTGADTNEAPPLLWAQLYDFGDTVVMLALHQPYKAKPYYATRLWVKRDGRFQLAASYHTTIEDVPAFTLLEQLPAK